MEYYEVDFVNGYGMCVKASRQLTVEEANEFYNEDASKNGGILSVFGPYTRDEVAPFYDMSNEDQWLVFE